VVVKEIAFLLSIPFSLGAEAVPGFIRNLESVYLESKVVANLIYASKLIVIRRRLEFGGTVEPHHLHEILTADDLEAMEKCLRLVSRFQFIFVTTSIRHFETYNLEFLSGLLSGSFRGSFRGPVL